LYAWLAIVRLSDAVGDQPLITDDCAAHTDEAGGDLEVDLIVRENEDCDNL
jgi:hypothetical protein